MPRKSKKQKIEDLENDIAKLKLAKIRHKEKVLDIVKQKIGEIKRLRAGWERKVSEWYKHYNNEWVKSYYSGSAKVFWSATFEAIEVVKTVFMELLFPKGEVPFDILPVEKSDAEKARDVWKPLLAFQAEKRIGLEQKAELAIETLLVCGTCVVKTPYTYNTKWINKGGKLQDLPTDDYPDFIPWDLKKVYFDPGARRVEDLDIVVFESDPSIDQVRRLDKKYNSKGIYENTDKLEEIEYQREMPDVNKYASHIGQINLKEAWLNYDLNDDGIAEEIVCVIANDKLVIRLAPNPYEIQEKPVLICGLFPQRDLLIGKGLPESVFEMQVQLNDAANQTLDNATHIINNMWAFDQTRLDRASARIHLKSRPDGIIPIKHGDPRTAVVPVEKPNVMDAGLLEIKLLLDRIRSTTMGEYVVQGLPGQYRPTATEYSGQQMMASTRIKRYVKKFERLIIKPFLRKAYEYDMQYMTRKEFLKILGEKGAKYKEVPMSKLRIDCDFIPVGTLEMESKPTAITLMTNFLNVVMKAPLPVLLQLMRLNLGGIAEELADRFGLPKDRIFYDDPSPEMVSPEDENELLKDGHKIYPKMQENHIRHMMVHSTVKEAQEHLMMHRNMMIQIEQMAQRATAGIPTQEMPKGTERANVGQMEGMAQRPPGQF